MKELKGETGVARVAPLPEPLLTIALKRAQRSYRWWSLSVMPAVILTALLLNLRQRTVLYRLLVPLAFSFRPPIDDPEFLLAAVQALTEIGDGGALPMLERLSREADDYRVRTAARDALPTLRASRTQGLLL